MNLIDLGYADPEPVMASPRRAQLDRRLLRRVAALVTLLLCFTTLTYSVRPQSHALRRLWSLSGLSGPITGVAGHAVLVAGGPQNRTLSAYDLVDGHRRWAHEMAGDFSFVEASRDSRVLLIPTDERTVPVGDTSYTAYTATTAIDAATGAELWHVAGTGFDWSTAAGTGLMQQWSPDGTSIAALRLVRLADGATIWSRKTPDTRQVVLMGADPRHADRVATVDDFGNVAVLRLADGTDAARVQLDWAASVPEAGELSELAAWGDALYVLRSEPHEAVATAYSDRTFRRLWSVRTAINDDGVHPCGPILCVADGTGLTGYDWGTGKVRWRMPSKYFGSALGDGTLFVSNRDSSQVLVDAMTGRLIADLGDTVVVPSTDGDPWLTLGSSSTAPGRTVVRKVDSRTGAITLLGVIDAVGEREWDCSTVDSLLVCSDRQGTLSVTAVTAGG